jgi:hypothetical protein
VNPEHSFLHPSAVLFNGGVFKSEILAQRVMDTINDWLYMEGAEPARMLEGADLDLAVARGAAYYGYARRGGGVRIRGGTARSYYVGVESSMPAIPGMEPPIQALCVAPFGMEEGSELELPGQEFGLVVGEPVHFRFFGSTTRRQDQIGDGARLLGSGRAAGTERDPGDPAGGRPQPGRRRAGQAACAGDRVRHAGTGGGGATASAGRSNSTSAAKASDQAGDSGAGPGRHRPRHHQHGAGLCPARAAPVELFAIDQLVAPGEVAAAPLLPSNRYHPLEGELAPGELQLPWHAMTSPACAVAVGRLARSLGAATPGRLVASAKSWLSHPGRRPHGADPALGRRPTTCRRFRRWRPAPATWRTCARPGTRFPQQPLQRQQIVLTMPASFDEGARALTLEAARLAGLPRLRLLEEPQAALYDWLHRHRATLAEELQGRAPGAGGRRRRRHHRLQPGQGRTARTANRSDPHRRRQPPDPRRRQHGPGAGPPGRGAHAGRMAGTAPAPVAARLAQLTERCRAAKEQLLAPMRRNR